MQNKSKTLIILILSAVCNFAYAQNQQNPQRGNKLGGTQINGNCYVISGTFVNVVNSKTEYKEAFQRISSLKTADYKSNKAEATDKIAQYTNASEAGNPNDDENKNAQVELRGEYFKTGGTYLVIN